MKKKSKLLVLIITFLVLSTGCTKYIKGENNKTLTNETTGQNITSNILCLPESEENLKIYEENKDKLDVDYDSLTKCSEFKPSDLKYNSLWESILIKPLAWVIIKLGMLVNNYGLSVIILGVLIRLLMLPFTKKTMSQSENMKKAQTEIQRIQKKYENAKDNTQTMQMSQEMMAVYKKYDISPTSGCLVAVLQLPILIAFLEAINRVPAIFEEYFLSLQLGTTPLVGIKTGNLMYFILIALIMLTTYFSFKYSMNNSTGDDAQAKQMKTMLIVMLVIITLTSFSLPTALALYWIVSNSIMIFQNYYIKLTKKNQGGKRSKHGSK